MPIQHAVTNGRRKAVKFPVKQFSLTDGQLSLLDTCLSIAVEKFRENAKILADVEGHGRMIRQFQDQAEETETLRLRIALAEAVHIGGECE